MLIFAFSYWFCFISAIFFLHQETTSAYFHRHKHKHRSWGASICGKADSSCWLPRRKTTREESERSILIWVHELLKILFGINLVIQSNLRKVAMSLVQNLDGNFYPVRLSILAQLHPLTVEDLGKRSSSQTVALKQIYYVIQNMGEFKSFWSELLLDHQVYGPRFFTTNSLVPWGKKQF